MQATFCEPLLVLECPALQGGVAFSENEKVAIAGNLLVSVFDLETGGMLVKMEQETRVRCVAISKDGSCLAVGGFDKLVRMQLIERGTQLYHFPNGQIERHFTDGLKEIRFADGSIKSILSNGEVQSLSGFLAPG